MVNFMCADFRKWCQRRRTKKYNKNHIFIVFLVFRSIRPQRRCCSRCIHASHAKAKFFKKYTTLECTFREYKMDTRWRKNRLAFLYNGRWHNFYMQHRLSTFSFSCQRNDKRQASGSDVYVSPTRFTRNRIVYINTNRQEKRSEYTGGGSGHALLRRLFVPLDVRTRKTVQTFAGCRGRPVVRFYNNRKHVCTKLPRRVRLQGVRNDEKYRLAWRGYVRNGATVYVKRASYFPSRLKPFIHSVLRKPFSRSQKKSNRLQRRPVKLVGIHTFAGTT